MVATGYPFELCVRGMGFVNYLFIIYRLLNLISFAKSAWAEAGAARMGSASKTW